MAKSKVRLNALHMPALALAIAMATWHFAAAAGDPTDSKIHIVAADLDHGRKLYEVGCDACHTTNVHWRDKRLADSWPALWDQVNRWQRNSGQDWQPADINDVAAYLNERFYHFQCPANECAEKAAVLHLEAGARR